LPATWTGRRLPPLLVLALLAGCGDMSSTTFPPACPHTGILADVADITRYRPGATGHDLTDLVLDGRITGVAGDCKRASLRQLDVTVKVSMTLARGPAASAGVEAVPFFVAVSEAGQILDKQVFRVLPEFSSNADTARLTSDAVTISLPIAPDKPGSAYEVVVGYQLTPDELAINRQRGPR
jgi:hypothetical protein